VTDIPKQPNLFAVEKAMDRVYDSVKHKVVQDFMKNKDNIRQMLLMQAQLLALQVETLESAGFSRQEAIGIATRHLLSGSQGGKEKPQSED
jgi:hypothetical protein